MTVSAIKLRAFEELQVGMEASIDRVVASGDAAAFAAVTGDYNPVHLDDAYAKKTMFGGCIAHGMLTASYISAVFARELPGPGAIYISQTLNFMAPVRVGDTVRTKVKVVELFPTKRRVRFECQSTVAGKTVLSGEAMLQIPVSPT